MLAVIPIRGAGVCWRPVRGTCAYPARRNRRKGEISGLVGSAAYAASPTNPYLFGCPPLLICLSQWASYRTVSHCKRLAALSLLSERRALISAATMVCGKPIKML